MPLAAGRDTVVFPGFDGGAEWGGSAFDPETALLYVNANDLPWTGAMAESTGAAGGRTLYLQNCAACHRDDRSGAPPQLPSLLDVEHRRSRAELTTIVTRGAGRMPGFPDFDPTAVDAVIDYVITGQDTPVAARRISDVLRCDIASPGTTDSSIRRAIRRLRLRGER